MEEQEGGAAKEDNTKRYTYPLIRVIWIFLNKIDFFSLSLFSINKSSFYIEYISKNLKRILMAIFHALLR